MSVISTPETILVTDYEFIFLGGTKLSHTISPEDSFSELEDRYILAWPGVSEVAEVFKASLLQKGTRVRQVSAAGEESAVDRVVREIKEKEARAQGATVKGAAPSPQG